MSEMQALLAQLTPEQRKRLEERLFAPSATPPKAQIPRRAASAALPLSFAQQRMWLIQQASPQNAFYNMPSALRLQGKLNRDALQKALDTIHQRHEALRTRFPMREGQPIQQICEAKSIAIPLIDLSAIPGAEQTNYLQAALRAQTLQVFQLAEDLPQRVTLYRLAAEDHVLLFVTHHIVSDLFSATFIQREFCQFYQAACEGQPLQGDILPIQYADFALWQRQAMQTEQWQKQLAYWKSQLSGDLPILELPTDHSRTAPADQGAKEQLWLSTTLVSELKRLSRQEHVTLFMTLLTAYQSLLYRYSGQEEMLIGTPVTNRTRAEVERVIGFFANTLPLRADLRGDPTVRELLARTRQVALAAYSNADLPFEKLVEEVHPLRDPNRPILCQTLFTFAEHHQEEYTLPNLGVSELEIDKGLAEFDLLLDIVAKQQGLQITLHYRTDLFEPRTIQQMLGHLQNILQAMLATPDEHISRLPILSATEKEQLLHTWNQTYVAIPPMLLHRMVEQQCQERPHQIALIHCDQQLTYAELNRAANQLAHLLYQKGVGKETSETFVAIFLPRSPQAIIAMLAVLKAGGAFLMLDPTWPVERQQTILNQGQIKFVITNQAVSEQFKAIPPTNVPFETICLDAWHQRLRQASIENLAGPLSSERLAYVVYTSGSTGAPKGVMCTHQAMANYVLFFGRVMALSPKDRRLQFASVASELLIAEVFNTLRAGATLILRPADEAPSIKEFLHLLDRYQITVSSLPVAYWQQWTQAMLAEEVAVPPSLRVVVTGMDRVQSEPFQIWREQIGNRILWFNAYGPAETTCVCTAYQANFGSGQKLERVPIGRPINNVTHYILDQQMQPVPIGVPGELYVGGSGVARGYLGQPDLTAEKFVANPFGPGRLYRTGDFVRYLVSGDIEFIGRKDHQVKLRGFRIELAEIENMLNQHPAIQASVVSLVERTSADRQLVAYWVAKPQMTISTPELVGWLKAKLPAYMIPTLFVALAALPTVANGKVDRRALPLPDFNLARALTPPISPRTPTEQTLLQLWQALLNVEQIGIYDDFFQLGGHSLLAVRLMTQIEQRFQQPVPLRDFIFNPTIAHLASLLDGTSVRSTLEEQADGQRAVQGSSMPTPADDAALRLLYDALEDQTKIQQLRNAVARPSTRPRLLRALEQLPQPAALQLLAWGVAQPWVQRRYLPGQTALVQEFLAGLEQAPRQQDLVAQCLFFGCLSQFGLRDAIFQRLRRECTIPVHGVDRLDAARIQQQGVILLGSHTYQTAYFSGLKLAQRGIGGMRFFLKTLAVDKVIAEQILYARQLELAHQTLRQGGVIAIAPDGNHGYGPQRTAAFHGRKRNFHTSFAELALLTNAQLFFIASDLQRYDQFSFRLVGPFDMGSEAMTHEERVQHLMAQYVAQLRMQWAKNPWALPWWLMGEHLAYPPV